jgi:starvation-inducible DNA-binding protein
MALHNAVYRWEGRVPAIDLRIGLFDSFRMRSTRLYRTKNDLPAKLREKMIVLLNARLADSIDLQTQCKQAHWNVKGPDFIALHELFDKVNEDVEEYVDLIAERAVQLGGVA